MIKILIAWLLCFANAAYAGPEIRSSAVAESVPYVDNVSPAFNATNVQDALDVLKTQVAGGIINYNVVATTTFSTSSVTNVMLTGMTVTPKSGTYGVWFNANCAGTGSGQSITVTIYNNGAAVTDSARIGVTPAGGHEITCSTQTITQVTGTQAISIEVNTSGSLTVTGRSLLLTRLGP